jgi:hypothetical protein
MLNFYLAVVLLFFFVSGLTLGGLAVVGQYPCLDMDEKYSQQECVVHDGVVAQYSLEGYVDTHWILLRVSAKESATGHVTSNVTGVVGGWIFIDRFPMPPLHGLLTKVPDGQSIFSNDVAISEEMAFEFRDSLVGHTYPCLVPRPVSGGDLLVNEIDKKSVDCSRGM